MLQRRNSQSRCAGLTGPSEGCFVRDSGVGLQGESYPRVLGPLLLRAFDPLSPRVFGPLTYK